MPITLTDKDGVEHTFRASASAIAKHEKQCRAEGGSYSLMDDLDNERFSFDAFDRLCQFIGVESYEKWVEMGFGMETLLKDVWAGSALGDLGFPVPASSAASSDQADSPSVTA